MLLLHEVHIVDILEDLAESRMAYMKGNCGEWKEQLFKGIQNMFLELYE